jgi:hypothetical protein
MNKVFIILCVFNLACIKAMETNMETNISCINFPEPSLKNPTRIEIHNNPTPNSKAVHLGMWPWWITAAPLDDSSQESNDLKGQESNDLKGDELYNTPLENFETPIKLAVSKQCLEQKVQD